MNPPLIDTHCHLDSQTFETELEQVVDRARESGIEDMITIGITLETSQAAIAVARRFDRVHAVVGIQPNYASEAGPDDFDEIVRLCDDDQVVGIGETGLDKYWDHAPLDVQEALFRRHIELSYQTGLPFVVHCREAEDDTVRVLAECAERAGRPLNGVMHSFCGNSEVAAQCLALGMHISFAGMVTFRKNDALREVARTVPLDRLLVETDSPYLAPQAKRGKRNEPAYVRFTAENLAETRGESVEQLATATTENARRLFCLPSH